MHKRARLRLLSALAAALVWALLLDMTPPFGYAAPAESRANTPSAVPSAPSDSIGTAFVQRATPSNIDRDETIIDHPLTNNQPDAMVFATPVWNPGGVGGVSDDDPIGVYYTGTNWSIFNQDNQPMPLGAAFNVLIPSADAPAFVDLATGPKTNGNYTEIDDPLTNNQPGAILLVTPNWNPDQAGGVYDDHPIGVWYSSSSNKWDIMNQDRAQMPVGAAFNVLVLPGPGGPAFVQVATASNIHGYSTEIDNPLTNNQPDAIVHVTPNWNRGGMGGVYDNAPIGVRYDADTNRWAIFNQDQTPMPLGAAFNVIVPITEPQTIQVPSFYMDVSASGGGTSVSLGRAIELHGLTIQRGALPSGTAGFTGSVNGTAFTAALTLGVTSYDPLVLSLQRFQISLATGQSADISDIGTVPIAVPGPTDFTKTVSQHVSGLGNITFTFSGEAQTTTQ